MSSHFFPLTLVECIKKKKTQMVNRLTVLYYWNHHMCVVNEGNFLFLKVYIEEINRSIIELVIRSIGHAMTVLCALSIGNRCTFLCNVIIKKKCVLVHIHLLCFFYVAPVESSYKFFFRCYLWFIRPTIFHYSSFAHHFLLFFLSSFASLWRVMMFLIIPINSLQSVHAACNKLFSNIDYTNT